MNHGRAFRPLMWVAVLLAPALSEPAPRANHRVAIAYVPAGSGWRQLVPATREGFTQLRQSGFNTVCLPFPRSAPPEFKGPGRWFEAPEVLDPYRQTIQLAKERGRKGNQAPLQVWFWMHFGLTADTAAGESRTVNGDGVEGTAVCPLDAHFWDQTLIPKGVALAGLTGTDAVLFELEVYDGIGRYDREEPCFCDRCLRRFLDAAGHAEPVPARAQRRGWLTDHGWLEGLVKWEEHELLARVAAWRTAVRRAQPAVRLGFYIGPTAADNWFHRAVAQGLSEPGQPLLNMDQRTYYGIGINWDRGGTRHPLWDWHRIQQGIFRTWNVPAEIVHGLYLDTPIANLSPKEVERFCFLAAVTGDGYWLWNETREPSPFFQAFRTAAVKAELALRTPGDFVQQMDVWVGVREQEGYDVSWSRQLLARARQALAANDAAMAVVWAFQAEWLLRT